MQKQQYSDAEVLQKLRSFCAYRDRAISEVQQKAKSLGANQKEIVNQINQLQKEGFIDDRRFAEVYARSKFRQNQWGKHKIRAALFQKKVAASFIDLAILELDEIDYENCISNLITKYNRNGKSADQIFQKLKIKGFEGDLIYSNMKSQGLV